MATSSVPTPRRSTIRGGRRKKDGVEDAGWMQDGNGRTRATRPPAIHHPAIPSPTVPIGGADLSRQRLLRATGLLPALERWAVQHFPSLVPALSSNRYHPPTFLVNDETARYPCYIAHLKSRPACQVTYFYLVNSHNGLRIHSAPVSFSSLGFALFVLLFLVDVID